jgi:DNA-binding winged helix-turn-helix (wHTH) protein
VSTRLRGAVIRYTRPLVTPPVRFRFAEFVLSPRQRLLLRHGRPVALIPKYLDLLLLLVVRRRDAVSKQAIFEEVWSDVVVSDGALSQAVRTLRRTLGDDSREPRFIRTVSRHGYQFVWADVIEEVDEGQVATAAAPPASGTAENVATLVDRLTAAARAGRAAEDEARDVAERLHALGTADAMTHIVARPGHAPAVAMMRDARWNVPGAGRVPLLSDPEAARAVLALVRLRISDAGRMVARRWASAAAAGALGGAAAGLCGGVALALSPMSSARPQSSLALAAIGALAGGVGAAGIGAGLAAAEVLARSRRGLALAAFGAVSGALVASIAHLLLGALLDGLFGLHLSYDAGAIDGLVLGAAAGVGYALATPQPPGGGLAAPSGRRRVAASVIVGACCAVAAIVLSLSGRLLVGGLVHEVARLSRDAELVLAPLGHFIGEPGFGPITRALLGGFEGAAFGGALTWGLTRRPAPSQSPVVSARLMTDD